MSAPRLNRVVADFSATATRNNTIRLKDLRGQNVVIYFYPKDSTPGCTSEGQDFRDLHAKFRRQGAIVLGVSRDSIASHEKFRDQQKFPFDLISDPDEALCRKFDVIQEKTLYGHKFMGIEWLQGQSQRACHRSSVGRQRAMIEGTQQPPPGRKSYAPSCL